MFSKKVACVTLLAVFGCVDPAHAVAFRLTAGTAGPGGVTNQGTFTSVGNATTVNFNGQTVNNGSFTFGPAGNTATYSGITGNTSIRADQFAPPYQQGQTTRRVAPPSDNTSQYLATFNPNPVTINFSTLQNYFGWDWGYADANNSISFQRVSGNTVTTLSTYTAANIFGNPVPTNPEPSSYVDFISTNNTTDAFNRVVLSNATTSGTTGYETDNHAYRAVPFELSPRLGTLALVAWGLGIGLKRKLKNNPKLLSQLMSK